MSINKKDAIITFDYEVFLGRQTGTVEKCVINPTKSILRILEEYNAKAIFFVDASWLLFLRENSFDEFLIVAEQLNTICKSGSSVELHLHPQWLDAYYSNGKIEFSTYQNYKLHSLDKKAIISLFEKSVDLLESITGQKISCFRAGGWCIEPFIKLKEAFERINIKYDFSVVAGAKLNEGKVYDYDYSKIPGLPYYKFNTNVMGLEFSGNFIELPLSTYNNNPVLKIVNKVLLTLKKDKIYGDGVGFKENSTKNKVLRLFQFSRGMLSLDKTHSFVFRYLLWSFFRKKKLAVIVSHPKTLSPQALINLNFVSENFNTCNAKELDELLIR